MSRSSGGGKERRSVLGREAREQYNKYKLKHKLWKRSPLCTLLAQDYDWNGQGLHGAIFDVFSMCKDHSSVAENLLYIHVPKFSHQLLAPKSVR